MKTVRPQPAERIPANARTRARGKRRLPVMVAALLACVPLTAADLPVPADVFVTSGEAYYRQLAGEFQGRAIVDQVSDRAVLQWSSFDVGAGQKVTFVQPRDISVALNRILQESPSRILGAIESRVGLPGAAIADIDKMPIGGQIYLINRNGFIFGSEAQVNTNTLLASSLNITDQVFEQTGLAEAINVGGGVASLTAFQGPSGEILIERGAELVTAEGGRIFLFAPRVENAGVLRTPGGQTLIAAAQNRVYLDFSPLTGIRGLTVEVELGGEVVNFGDIIAERGNITLAGMLLDQQGRLRATTSIDENGSILLQARDIASARPGSNIREQGGRRQVFPERGGVLLLGDGSVTEVLPASASTATAPLDKPQAASRVSLMGREVRLGGGSTLRATGGEIDISATANPSNFKFPGAAGPVFVPSDATLVVEDGALIDVAGTRTTVLPMSRNQVDVELRGSELADAPLQRDGVVRGVRVSVDAREGTQFAAVQNAVANIGRGIDERLSAGGSILLQAEGTVRVESGATLDVSGGAVTYQSGLVATTKLVSNGQVVDIRDADPNARIDAVFQGSRKTHGSWGVTETFADTTGMSDSRLEPGYVEGKDAGSLVVRAPQASFEGDLLADVVTGRNQRLPGATRDGLERIARPFQELPLGGGLLLALDPIPGRAQDVIVDSIAPPGALWLDPDLLMRSGLGALQIRTLGDFRVAEQVDLALRGGFRFDVSARNVLIDGALRAPQGDFRFGARFVTSSADGRILFGDGARVDASGYWVNDYLTGSAGPLFPVWIDGGNIALNAAGDLIMSSRSRLAVDGGAWQRADGALIDGAGGRIALRTTGVDNRFLPTLNLSGYALERGGRLEIEANSLALFSRDVLEPVFVGTPPSPDDFPIRDPFPDLPFVSKVDVFLPSALFRLFGFEEFAVTANRDALVVLGNGPIVARQTNLRLRDGYLARTSGTALMAMSAGFLRPEYERRPVTLALAYGRADGPFVDESGLIVRAGAALDVGVGGRLTLASTGSMWIDGTLRARGGHIGLDLLRPEVASDFNPRQALLIDHGAWLDVSGAFLPVPDRLGLRRGRLFDGGSIAIDAEMGFVFSRSGARYDVGGSAGLLDLPVDLSLRLAPRWVSSDAGSIRIRSAEGGTLDGVFNALNSRPESRGDGLGGRFEVEFDSRDRNVPLESVRPGFSDADRVIALVDMVRDFDAGYAASVPLMFRDRLELAPEALPAQGFDTLSIAARNLEPQTGAVGFVIRRTDGRIRIEQDLNLVLGRRLALNAAILDVAPGVAAALEAPFVSLGYDDILPAFVNPVLGGSGTVDVRAGFFELVGRQRLQGVGQFSATADEMRLRGVLSNFRSRDLVGTFESAADVVLNTARLYPTTLTRFDLLTSGDLTLGATGAATADPGALFSYGGAVRVLSRNLSVDTTLLAPGGRIDLTATADLTLGSAARIGTALAAPVQLFGQTQAGLDWIYPFPDGTVRVFDQLPAPAIRLDGARVTTAAGSVIDASGGGELLAWEFIAGPGGSRDVLAPANAGGTFAILPAERLAAVPYDEALFAGFRYGFDTTINLEAGSGVPAGEYLVLPARYALLPGASLVTPVNGLLDLIPGEVRRGADGAPIVAGRFSGAGSPRSGDRYLGFKIRPGSFARTASEFTLASASAFFDLPDRARHVPENAGNIAIRTGGQFALAGLVQALGDAARNGRDGSLGLAAPRVAVVGNCDDCAALQADGFSTLLDDALNALRVRTLVIGGELRAEAAGDRLIADAAEVLLTAGARLEQPEIALVARDELTVEADVEVTAELPDSARQRRVLVVGAEDQVLLASGDVVALERVSRGGAATGAVRVAAGASVFGAGTIGVNAPGSAALDGALLTRRGRLDVGASDLLLGDGAGAGEDGLRLSGAQLELVDAAEIALVAARAIELAGTFDLAVDAFAIDTPVLRARPGTGLSVSATDVEFANRFGTAAVAPVPGDGTFAIDAQRIRFTGGRLSAVGFLDLGLAASEGVFGRGDAGLVAFGDGAPVDIELRTPLVHVASGSRLTFDTDGDLSVLRTDESPAAPIVEPHGVGGNIALAAGSVRVDTRLVARSGGIDIAARDPAGDVTLGAFADLDASGLELRGQVERLATPGGRVALTSARNIDAAVGSNIDVGAPAVAGRVDVRAATGAAQLLGTVASGAGSGGVFAIDAQDLVGLDLLNATLAQAGGFATRSYRQRTGDLRFAADTTMAVNRLDAAADNGALLFAGQLAFTGPDAAAVLSGRTAVDFTGTLAGSTGRLDLDALADSGRVLFDPAATDGLQSGELRVRLAAGGALDGRAALQVPTNLSASVELVERYDVPGSQFGSVQQQALRTRLETRAAGLDAARTALGLDDPVALRVGAWIAGSGDLSFTERFDLADWRFGDAPGRLRVTAPGDIVFGADLSDGFRTDSEFEIPLPRLQRDASWGYEIVAGHDVSGAAATAYRPGQGSVTIRQDASVRTGTGDIVVRAGGNFRLDGQTATLYTSGRSTGAAGFSDEFKLFLLQDAEFPDQGGAIDLQVDGDLIGAHSTQLISQYMSRYGGRFFDTVMPTLYGVDFYTLVVRPGTGELLTVPTFQQGIGSFGGGAVRVSAGGDMRELSVIAPEIHRHVGDARDVSLSDVVFSDNSFATQGPSSFLVRAGGDISGGVLYAGGVTAQVAAGGNVRRGANGLGMLIGLGGGALDLWAGRDAYVESVFNPTMLTQSLGTNIPLLQRDPEETYFFSYGESAGVSLNALAGNVVYSADTQGIFAQYNFADGNATYDLRRLVGNEPFPGRALDDFVFTVLPGSTRLTSAAGDVDLRGNLTLFPAPLGGLSIFAYRDVTSPAALRNVLISDADPTLLPSRAAPQANLAETRNRLRPTAAIPATIHARVPVHIDDPVPSRIEALTGAIATPSLSIYSAEPVELVAAGNLDLRLLSAQNNRPGDITRVQSGGTIRLLANRDDEGRVSPDAKAITVAGPGGLEVLAGSGIDLGTSRGIETIGNLENPALPSRGADILVLTGNADGPQLDAFIERFIVADAAEREFAAERLGIADLDDAEAARLLLLALSDAEKRKLAFPALFRVLGRSGADASTLIAQEAPRSDILLAYRDGFVALETLFPRGTFLAEDDDFLFGGDSTLETVFSTARPQDIEQFLSGVPEDLLQGTTIDTAFAGDLSLFFSKISTLAGGEIALVVPGGKVNVGLTVDFGTGKPPSELGIVAQGDGGVSLLADGNIEVNRSRVFTLNGGDINIWSSNGNVDAGRGARNTVSTPALRAALGENDSIVKVVPPAVSGSGIAADDGSSGRLPDILLSTPKGVVDAGDAGIRTPGRLFTAALDVVGRDNIDAGSFVGAPADNVVLSADLANVGDSAASAVQGIAGLASGSASESGGGATDEAAAALGWLEVFLEGFGPEFCDPERDPGCRSTTTN